MAFNKHKKTRSTKKSQRFPKRNSPEWKGPIVDYKEVELLRKFMTSSSKMMSRKRAGTTTREQEAVKLAIKYARYMALVPYRGI
ncbi:MAG: 30S ribosomal protein S18 [Phycisphaerae bacterium]|nr:30S ribosomal protein S18 [Phycisphaerae bacterium]